MRFTLIATASVIYLVAQCGADEKVTATKRPLIPDAIKQGIRDQAAKRYPDDFSMQQFVVKEQTAAYRSMQEMSDDDLPLDAQRAIVKAAVQRYPVDYSMQLFVCNEQFDAYKKLLAYKADKVPQKVLASIIEKAISRYPHDYSMRLFFVESQVESYLELQED